MPMIMRRQLQNVLKYTVFRWVLAGLITVSALIIVVVQPVRAQYASITNRSMKLSNSEPSAVSRYEASFTAAAAPNLGSIKIEFCSNTALFELSCNAPGGFDASAAVLAAQTGDTGFVIDPLSTANVIILSRAPTASSGTPSAYTFDNVTNASAADSQYARYSMYPTIDASGPMQDRGSVAYALNPLFDVSSEVPPNLEFCVAQTISSVNCTDLSGDYLNLGDFSATQARLGSMQMVVATNAASGYNISVNGNGMASGNNVIPALPQPTASAPGNSQFGINLRANSNPSGGQEPGGPGGGSAFGDYGIPNRFVFRAGDVIATKSLPEDYRKYTVSYLVNISQSQAAGVYAGTYTYVALGNF